MTNNANTTHVDHPKQPTRDGDALNGGTYIPPRPIEDTHPTTAEPFEYESSVAVIADNKTQKDYKYTYQQYLACSQCCDGCTSSIRHWFQNSAWPGMGLFGESYLLFSVGTLKPVWEMLYQDCWAGDDGDVCSTALLNSITLTLVVGVIIGMIVLGTIANQIGRRAGSIVTATLMTFGAVGMSVCSMLLSDNPSFLFGSMAILLFVFGIGVGGECPLSAASANEKAMTELKTRISRENENCNNECTEGASATNFGRGKDVLLVFSMQGVGVFCNAMTITALLLITNQVGNQYNSQMLLAIWQITYAVGAVVMSYVLVTRILYLEESQVWASDKEMREDDISINSDVHHRHNAGVSPLSPSGNSLDAALGQQILSSLSMPSGTSSTFADYGRQTLPHMPSTTSEDDRNSSANYLLLRNYGYRLLGTSLSWLLWDVAFYGNKLFQSSFLVALFGDNDVTLFQLTGAATLNALVALAGYFAAAFIVDKPSVGRFKLQTYGFSITGALFVCCGFLRDSISTPSLVILYFLSSFFGQCGPNATTFLIPAEVFPTECRTMCHGISAASGKVGALIAAMLFSYVDEMHLFLISGYFSFAAALITFLTIPETSTLDLYECDRKWRMILAGRKADYAGPAIQPEYLSYIERRKHGYEW